MLVVAMWLLGGTLGLAVALSFIAAGCDPNEGTSPAKPRTQTPRCPVGSERADPHLPAGESAIVLGCGRTPSGRRVEIYSFRDAGGPCLNIAGLPGGPRACGSAPSERVPPSRAAIAGEAIVRRSPTARLELYGETAPSVRRVVLRYRLPGGRAGERSATLIRMTNKVALTAARIRKPFGYFVGSVPSRAKEIVAEGRESTGEPLGRFSFDPIVRSMHPTVFIVREQ